MTFKEIWDEAYKKALHSGLPDDIAKKEGDKAVMIVMAKGLGVTKNDVSYVKVRVRTNNGE